MKPTRNPMSGLFSGMILFLAGLMRALGLAEGAAENRFSVGGTYRFEAFQLFPNGPSAWTNEGTFRVVVNGCQWSIALQPNPVSRPPHPPLRVKELVAVFDGKTIHELYSVSPPSEFKGKNVDRAQLVNGPIPQRLDQRIQHVWLGLAAGCFFRSNAPGYHPRLSLPPEDHQRHDNSRLVFMDWSWSADGAWNPSWVCSRGEESADTAAKRPAAAETNLFLSVQTWTNLAEMQVAGSFQVTEFFSRKASVQTTCRVTDLTPNPNATITLPVLSSETYITDRRLTREPPYVPVQFLLNQWPSVDYSQSVFARLKSAGTFATPTSSVHPLRRTLLLTIMGATALVLSLLAWRARKNKPTTETIKE